MVVDPEGCYPPVVQLYVDLSLPRGGKTIKRGGLWWKIRPYRIRFGGSHVCEYRIRSFCFVCK